MPAKITHFDDERILNLKEKPCPFCGSHETGNMFFSESLFGPLRYYSHCLNCKARGPVKDYPDLATKAWNSVENRGKLCL